MNEFLQSELTYVKGIGPKKAEILEKQLNIRCVEDLINYFPYRHDDRSEFQKIAAIREDLPSVQIKGKIMSIKEVGQGRGARLSGVFTDGEDHIELVWFQGVRFLKSVLPIGKEVVIYGKPNYYRGIPNITHPEVEELAARKIEAGLVPSYSSSELLKKRFVDTKFFKQALSHILADERFSVPEFLPADFLEKYQLIDRTLAFKQIHFPKDTQHLFLAKNRFKFEELFFLQWPIIQQKLKRDKFEKGIVFSLEKNLWEDFKKERLPFELTGAQHRVIGDIKRDVESGKQMNRLLQGDVGSGKTIVALAAVVMAFENGLQSALMAPTEILATQHFIGLSEMLEGSSIRLALLTGSTPKSERKELFRLLKMNEIHFLIGTHALIEDAVSFDNLGMVIIDEQHRFGVAQRARLQDKNTVKPHILVMTATPIPRTLAMSVYGDLDHSVIDEMPAGRKTIKTLHRYGFTRHKIWDFVKTEIEKGRQAYIVYPLIEESDTLPYRDLMNGFNDLLEYFPRPKYQVEMMHGQMKPQDKEEIMRRFKEGKIHVLVSTTVIEVGINVPNASIMIIESAEKFGLSQLHQLRGRVGRGSEQSYCILLSHKQLNENAKIRMQAMVNHSSGFELSDIDMKLRGFGDIAGTRQSGLDQLKLASLATDGEMVSLAQNALIDIFSADPDLQLPKYEKLKNHWKKISGNKEWSTVA